MESVWIWLNTPPGVAGVLDPFGLVYAAVFAVGFLASAYLTGPGGNDLGRHDLHPEAIHHWATVGLWIFGPGLFFFAMRALQINPLSFGEPIWLVGCLIALIVTTFRFATWWRRDYQVGARSRFHPLGDQPPIGHLIQKQHPHRPPHWKRGPGA